LCPVECLEEVFSGTTFDKHGSKPQLVMISK
jgi:hypothetical protein